MHTLIQIVLVLAAVGFGLWLFETFVTVIDAKYKAAIKGIVLFITFLWIISVLFGVSIPGFK